MKKIQIKDSTKILALFIMVPVILVAGMLLSGCGKDVVVMSPEEEEKWTKEQNQIYSEVQLPEFEAETLDGTKVTDKEVFRKYKLTMINIWGTFCGPCIEEMPDLAKLYKNLPEGTNLISICTDADDGEKYIKLAKEVIKKSCCKFDTLIPNQTLEKALTDRVTSFPTTIFVDSEGKIVGTPVFGGMSAKEYRGYMEKHLNEINQKVQES